MAIFDKNFLFESSSVFEESQFEEVSADMTVEPTMESVVEMNAELNESVYKLNTSLYIADILAEQSGQTALMEASLGDYWKKTKERFMAILEKVTGFFKNLLSKMDVMVKTGEGFIKKYEKVITKLASHKDAVFDVARENEQTADPDFMAGLIRGKGAEGFSSIAKDCIDQVKNMQKDAADALRTAGEKNMKEVKDAFKDNEQSMYRNISDNKAESDSECKKYYKAKLRGKGTGFRQRMDKAAIAKMLDYCKIWISSGKKNVANAEVDTERLIKECMKSINDFEKNQNEALKKNTTIMPLVSDAVASMNRMIGIGNYINGISFDTFNSTFRTYVGMLKSFVSKNSKLIDRSKLPKKESASESFLEAVMGELF